MRKSTEPSSRAKAAPAKKRVRSGLKPIPAFRTEAQERKFWETHDSTEYVDWTHAQSVRLPNLKPTSKSISLRLPIGLLEALRIEANRRDVPYQSLIKVWLSEMVEKKLHP
jgi:predicted DNA binding CopG/RHH family protein